MGEFADGVAYTQGVDLCRYLEDVLKATSSEIESVEVEPDGTWRIPEQTDDEGTDSDDDDNHMQGGLEVIDDSPMRGQQATTSRTTSNVIDLTLSDDDEPVIVLPRVSLDRTQSAAETLLNQFRDSTEAMIRSDSSEYAFSDILPEQIEEIEQRAMLAEHNRQQSDNNNSDGMSAASGTSANRAMQAVHAARTNTESPTFRDNVITVQRWMQEHNGDLQQGSNGALLSPALLTAPVSDLRHAPARGTFSEPLPQESSVPASRSLSAGAAAPGIMMAAQSRGNTTAMVESMALPPLQGPLGQPLRPSQLPDQAGPRPPMQTARGQGGHMPSAAALMNPHGTLLDWRGEHDVATHAGRVHARDESTSSPVQEPPAKRVNLAGGQTTITSVFRPALFGATTAVAPVAGTAPTASVVVPSMTSIPDSLTVVSATTSLSAVTPAATATVAPQVPSVPVPSAVPATTPVRPSMTTTRTLPALSPSTTNTTATPLHAPCGPAIAPSKTREQVLADIKNTAEEIRLLIASMSADRRVATESAAAAASPAGEATLPAISAAGADASAADVMALPPVLPPLTAMMETTGAETEAEAERLAPLVVTGDGTAVQDVEAPVVTEAGTPRTVVVAPELSTLATSEVPKEPSLGATAAEAPSLPTPSPSFTAIAAKSTVVPSTNGSIAGENSATTV
ncbi:uncharacterized protein V1518DRAFT_122898 [Limtongia smithiae]|uniref:uncharacterized protein n=1 Tax=Limtongia smithiae TaxID=1125753 RepID=UPI0034CF92A8